MTLLERIRHEDAARAATNRRDRRDALFVVVPLIVLAVSFIPSITR